MTSLEPLKIRLSSIIDRWEKEPVKMGNDLIPFGEINKDRVMADHIKGVIEPYLHQFEKGDEVEPLKPTQQELEEWKISKKLIPYVHSHYWGYLGLVKEKSYDGKVLVEFKGLNSEPGFPNPVWIEPYFLKHCKD